MKTTLLYLVLGAIMGIGGMAILQASTKNQPDRCELIKQQVIAEFDEIVAAKKFPSQDQQNYWRQISQGCQE